MRIGTQTRRNGMSGATLQHEFSQNAAIPPWPEQRARGVQAPPQAQQRPDTRRLLAVPSVSPEVSALYDACLVSDVSWWNCGMLALLRTLLTMGYSTLAEASADSEVFKEVARPRVEETEKHVIKPYNLAQYFEQARHIARPVERMPLQLLVAELKGMCAVQVLSSVRLVLKHTVPYLEEASKAKGALAGHSSDVKRLRTELTALIAKLEKAESVSEALDKAAQ